MKKKYIGLGVPGLAVMLLLSGCGSHGGSYAAQYNESTAYDSAAAVAEEAYMEAGYGVYESSPEYYGIDAVASETSEAQYDVSEEQVQNTELPEDAAQTSDRKLIRTVDLYTETEQYDDLLVNLETQITSLGGYVEYRYQYNGNPNDYYGSARRNSNLTVRIPADRLDEFISRVGEASNIINKEERVEDVTLQYVDLESHRNALQTEQERLLELLEQAETVEDLIAIESRLSQVRYELESMESQLRTLMNQVSYSTVNLSIQEVQRLTPVEEVSIWGRIRQGLANTFYNMGTGFQDGFVGFVINLPYIVLWLFIIVILFFVCRLLWRFCKKRFAKRAGKETVKTTGKLSGIIKKNKHQTEGVPETEEDKVSAGSASDTEEK